MRRGLTSHSTNLASSTYRVVAVEILSLALVALAVFEFGRERTALGLFLLTLGFVGVFVPPVEAGLRRAAGLASAEGQVEQRGPLPLSVRIFRLSPLIWLCAAGAFVGAGAVNIADDGTIVFSVVCIAAGGILGLLSIIWLVVRVTALRRSRE